MQISVPEICVSVFEIRTAKDVDIADAIIIPGGESTSMRIICEASEKRGGMLNYNPHPCGS
jgi:glutamine amidotransferase PdxT